MRSATVGPDPSSEDTHNNTRQVDISCGTKNELLSIQEPEKCEYFFKVTSPALCWPVEEQESVKEEL